MPRKGQAFPVDDDLRRRVLLHLKNEGRSKSWLSKELKLSSRSLINELLELDPSKKRVHQTTLLPEIHKVLGWPPPKMPSAPEDLAPDVVSDIVYLYERLDEAGRRATLTEARKQLDRILAGSKTR
jgi:hypothetical protein